MSEVDEIEEAEAEEAEAPVLRPVKTNRQKLTVAVGSKDEAKTLAAAVREHCGKDTNAFEFYGNAKYVADGVVLDVSYTSKGANKTDIIRSVQRLAKRAEVNVTDISAEVVADA